MMATRCQEKGWIIPGRIPKMTPWTATARMEKTRRLVPMVMKLINRTRTSSWSGNENMGVT